MQEDRKELHRKILVNIGVALAVLLFVVFVLPWLLRFFAPLVVAWIVAMIANPVVHFLEKRIRIMRKHGTALIIVFVLVVICGALYGIGVLMIGQVSSLMEELPTVYASVVDNLNELLQRLHSRYHVIPGNVQGILDSGEKNPQDYIMTALNGVLEGMQGGTFSKMGSAASSLIDFIVYAVLTILASYFMTVEMDRIDRYFRENTPEGIQTFFGKVSDICKKAIGGYFKAHFQIMVVIFFITVIPFSFMGISYSALLALIIAVVDFLPFFGAGTILWPWAIYKLTIGSYRYAAILLVLYLVVMVVRQLLEPKLIGDSVGIHSFAMLIYMLIGYRLGGMLGLIISIPVGMILAACYREGMFESYFRGVKILIQDINEYRKY